MGLLNPRIGRQGPGFLSFICLLLYPSDLALITRSEPLDEKSFDTLRQMLLAYIQSEYTYGSAESRSPCTSNT